MDIENVTISTLVLGIHCSAHLVYFLFNAPDIDHQLFRRELHETELSVSVSDKRETYKMCRTVGHQEDRLKTHFCQHQIYKYIYTQINDIMHIIAFLQGLNWIGTVWAEPRNMA